MAELSTLKVLVIDDDLNIRKIIKSVLHSIGVRDIAEATNGQEGYDLLKVPRSRNVTSYSGQGGGGRRKFDLVICDWMMPVMTGFELLTRVREDTFIKDTVFLMATAENEEDNIVRAVKGGVDDYIVKPFTASVLEKKLRKVVDKINAR